MLFYGCIKLRKNSEKALVKNEESPEAKTLREHAFQIRHALW
jgi:hypothetical protein